MKKILFSIFLSLAVLMPAVVEAQLPRPPCPPGLRCPGGGDATGLNTINDFITTIVTWLLSIAFALAVLFMIIGGIRYIISAGNEESAEAARGTVINALIGIVIIILSYVVINALVNLVSGPTLGP